MRILVSLLVVSAAAGLPAQQKSHLPAQVTSRVSVAPGGIQGNSHSDSCGGLSADGLLVAFGSSASNLVPNDFNQVHDVFVHQRVTGLLTRVSVDSRGVEGDGDSYVGPSSLSADGRFVAFISDAANLVPGDTNGVSDVFVHDRQTGVTSRVNVGPGGVEADGASWSASISADGARVAFTSQARNLVAGDTNGALDVFVHDRAAGTTTRASVDSSGAQANGNSQNAVISHDGQVVAFQSRAVNLTAQGSNGFDQVFTHDLATGATTLVSVGWLGQVGDGPSRFPWPSGDGRHVAFQSQASNLVPFDTNVQEDVFVHDRQTGATIRASVSTGGVEANGPSHAPTVSADGRVVVFVSAADNLVMADNNGLRDVFAHDVGVRWTSRVNVDEGGLEANGSTWNTPPVSADGRYVVFESAASNLVLGDSNTFRDVFVRDRIRVDFNGPAVWGSSVNFTVADAVGETGNLAWVLLSCTGTAGIPLPGGGVLPLTFDACTLFTMQVPALFSAPIGARGAASTVRFTWPAIPVGTTFWAAAMTIDPSAPAFVSTTGPVSFKAW